MSPGTRTGWPTKRYSSGRSISPGAERPPSSLAVDQNPPAPVLLDWFSAEPRSLALPSLTMSTGQWACLSIESDTLPIRVRLIAPSPLLPMTISAAPSSSAKPITSSSTAPILGSVSATVPLPHQPCVPVHQAPSGFLDRFPHPPPHGRRRRSPRSRMDTPEKGHNVQLGATPFGQLRHPSYSEGCLRGAVGCQKKLLREVLPHGLT